jgi:hypothetical protein
VRNQQWAINEKTVATARPQVENTPPRPSTFAAVQPQADAGETKNPVTWETGGGRVQGPRIFAIFGFHPEEIRQLQHPPPVALASPVVQTKDFGQ